MKKKAVFHGYFRSGNSCLQIFNCNCTLKHA